MKKKAKQSRANPPRKRAEDWQRWGAIIQVIHMHGGEGMLVECLPRRVKELVGPVRREELERDLMFLSPVVSRRDDKVYLSGVLADTYYAARKSTSHRQKHAVAIHVHKNLLNKLDSVLLDAGSACEAIAWEMARGNKGHFTVLTNNMAAINAFVTNRSIRLHLTGGNYVTDDESLIGERAKRALRGFFVKYSIVGVSGITSQHVYCHGIEGEEELKKAIWMMPAETLVIPATLEKFSGMDTYRFGELARAPRSISSRKKQVQLDDIALAEVESLRKNEQQVQATETNETVPQFNAGRCEIIIEPKWMIPECYPDKVRREELMGKVDDINNRQHLTGVRVIHAEVKQKEL